MQIGSADMKEILLNYNQLAPRYTSYPPATKFNSNFCELDYAKIIQDSNSTFPENISIYLHIPFCPKQCHYCGCNTAINFNKSMINRYLTALKNEIKMVAKFVDKNRKVTQIHWGGGTPNSIKISQITEIMELLEENFSIADNAEIAMECAVAYLNEDFISNLAKLGFNRISLGIQDFHDDVLSAVNRSVPKMPISEIMQILRKHNICDINFDLIYGLPLQTRESWQENLLQIIKLKPSRVATFSYAHVPWAMPQQKNLEKFTMVSSEEKLTMLTDSMQMLKAAGYKIIGMDHYALPENALSTALEKNTLHRNFQGYCSNEHTGQVYAFGASAITQLSNVYAQNFREIDHYCKMIEQNTFAIMRGYLLNQNEQICRNLINKIMCNSKIDLEEFAETYNLSIDQLFIITNCSNEKLKPLIKDGLISFNGKLLEISECGKLMVRIIAMAFDPTIEVNNNQFSKTI